MMHWTIHDGIGLRVGRNGDRGDPHTEPVEEEADLALGLGEVRRDCRRRHHVVEAAPMLVERQQQQRVERVRSVRGCARAYGAVDLVHEQIAVADIGHAADDDRRISRYDEDGAGGWKSLLL